MPDRSLGLPYEFYLISIALLILWASFKASHNKIIASVSALSFIYTIAITILCGFEKIKDNQYLLYSFGFCLITFLIGGCAWIMLDIYFKNPIQNFSKKMNK